MIQTIDRSAPRRPARPTTRSTVGAVALLGALLVPVGVSLPWFSLFAGLQPISALGTPNGIVLFAGAALAGLLAILTLVRGDRWMRRALTLTGIGLAAFSAYLIVGLVTVYREVSADPLVVAQPGPGLAVVAVGALLVLGASLLGD